MQRYFIMEPMRFTGVNAGRPLPPEAYTLVRDDFPVSAPVEPGDVLQPGLYWLALHDREGDAYVRLGGRVLV